MSSPTRAPLSRRSFLGAGLAAAALPLLAACSPAAPASPTPAPAAAAPAAPPTNTPAPAPTQAPAPTNTSAPAATNTPAPVPTNTTAPAATNTPAPAAASSGTFRVGLVTDVGKVDDKSFNQSAWEGVKAAGTALGATVKFIETTDPKDYGKNIDQFAQDNWDVIVTVGFGLGEATIAAAKQYPKIWFIGVDQFQADTVANLAGLIFEEDKSGYLAGALAGLLTKSGTIGQVLGTDVVPPVVRFGKGYEAGAKSVKSDIKVLTAYHPGGLAKGFSDPDWGKATATQWINQGADVIFGAGGNTGNGALLYCAEKNIPCIGVDTDQYLTLPQVDKVIVSSAMKLITPGVLGLVKDAKGGSIKAGNNIGPVGLAPFHDWDSKISGDIKDKLASIDKGLKDGSIQTGVKV
jgi:basic membrane protein A